MKNLVFLIFLLGCVFASLASPASAQSPARRLPGFNYSGGWLGADDAYSIPLTTTESVWLFGDTFVGDRTTKLRSQSKAMVRNSIGISDCEPGASCTVRYFWRHQYGPKPRSFFDTGTDKLWYWPLDGFLSGKTLYVALLAVRNKPGASSQEAFGFEIVGTKLATVQDALISPHAWHIRIQNLTGAHLWPGVSIVPEGKYVLWYTQVSEGEGRGYMTVMRVPRDKMANPPGAWQYLRKDGKWVAGLAKEDAMHVIEQAISEMSVRYHAPLKKWLAISTGLEFPSPRAVARIGDSPLGPWSEPQTLYEFPEMKRDSPDYDKDTFCYAAKEHTEFTQKKIALTYVCNSMVFSKTVANMSIYRPKGVILDLPQ
jgi:hypothetical protein